MKKLLALLFATPAVAAPASHGFLTTTEVVPDRAIEIETRVTDKNDLGDLHQRSTALWLAPAVGLTKNVELFVPIEMLWLSETGTMSTFTLSKFGGELRDRVARGDHYAVLFRVALERDVHIRNGGHTEFGLAASFDVAKVQFAVDNQLTFEANYGGVHIATRPGAGVSYLVRPDVRFGLEAYGVKSIDTAEPSWAVVGPSFSFTHDRFWLASTFGFGVYNISSAGSVVWGMGF